MGEGASPQAGPPPEATRRRSAGGAHHLDRLDDATLAWEYHGMATVTFEGNPVTTIGELPAVGAELPDFTLVGQDMAAVRRDDFRGRRIVLNIFPSLDTDTCSLAVRRFNQLALIWPNTVVICVSKDLPFAQRRFCAAEGLTEVVPGSAFRSTFGEDYGVTMTDGPLQGLLARSIVIADDQGKIIYTHLTPVIEDEPDYDEANRAVGCRQEL